MLSLSGPTYATPSTFSMKKTNQMKRRCYIKSRRHIDADDRRQVANEFSKHSQPLGGQGEDNVLYTIVNGKIAPPAVNVADAVSIGNNTLSMFRRSLPSGFHAKMSSPVNTMDYLKRGVKMGEKTVRC